MIPFPNKKYQIIYADPPWNINKHKCNKWKLIITDRYPTMKLDDIKNLPVRNLADNSCGLFLWTTNFLLPSAIQVMDSWGFKYRCCITWDKQGGISLEGIYTKTELCLFGYRGKLNINKTGKFIPTLISERRRKHSQKPEIMYQIIENNTPKPRIELFARQKRDGWDCWGNEV